MSDEQVTGLSTVSVVDELLGRPSRQAGESATEMAVHTAIAESCRQLRTGRAETVGQLRQRQPQAWAVFAVRLARQIAHDIGTQHPSVRAIYLAEHEATCDDLCFGEAAGAPITLIIVSDSHDPAVANGADGRDTALAGAVGKTLGWPRLIHLLDERVVSSSDIARRRGYGAMVSSLHLPALQVWHR